MKAADAVGKSGKCSGICLMETKTTGNERRAGFPSRGPNGGGPDIAGPREKDGGRPFSGEEVSGERTGPAHMKEERQ